MVKDFMGKTPDYQICEEPEDYKKQDNLNQRHFLTHSDFRFFFAPISFTIIQIVLVSFSVFKVKLTPILWLARV